MSSNNSSLPFELEEIAPPADALSTWASAQIAALMTRHGIATRHQAAEIAHICAISVSQARRKLRGAVWLFNEVVAICRHFDESLDAVFPDNASSVSPITQDPAQAGGSPSTCPATLLIDGRRLGCEIQLGPILAEPPGMPASTKEPGAPDLIATHQPAEGWLVSTHAGLARESLPGPHYTVQQLQIHTPPAPQGRARIAVLDDDAGSADALTDWFNELGYLAQAFTSPEALLATSLDAHDAYVIDLILGGGQTSQSVVEQIRQAQPRAPIVLLTGQLRDGTASEATLTTILRTQGVTFFEKPVRPAVLTAAIQSGLDRLATAHA